MPEKVPIPEPEVGKEEEPREEKGEGGPENEIRAGDYVMTPRGEMVVHGPFPVGENKFFCISPYDVHQEHPRMYVFDRSKLKHRNPEADVPGSEGGSEGRAKEDAEAAPVPSGENPEEGERVGIAEGEEERPETEKGPGWFARKWEGMKQFGRFAKTKEGRGVLMKATYDTIGAVVGLKALGDVGLLFAKKGDLYEYTKTKKERKEVREVVGDLAEYARQKKAEAPSEARQKMREARDAWFALEKEIKEKGENATDEDREKAGAAKREYESALEGVKEEAAGRERRPEDEKLKEAENFKKKLEEAKISPDEKKIFAHKLGLVINKHRGDKQVLHLERDKEVRQLTGAYLEGKVNGWRIARDWMNLGLSALVPAEAATAGGSRALAYGALGAMERTAKANKGFSKEEWKREIETRRNKSGAIRYRERIKNEGIEDPEKKKEVWQEIQKEISEEAGKNEEAPETRMAHIINDLTKVAAGEWWRAVRFQGKTEGREQGKEKWIDAVQAYAAAARALGLGGHALSDFLQGAETGGGGAALLEALQNKYEGGAGRIAGNVATDLFVKNPVRAFSAYPRMAGSGWKWITGWGEEESMSAIQSPEQEAPAKTGATATPTETSRGNAADAVRTVSQEGGAPSAAETPETSATPEKQETEELSLETKINLGKVEEKGGIWQAIRAQLKAHPKTWGFAGNVDNADEVNRWSNRATRDILKRDEYMKDGLETRVVWDKDHPVSYVLEKDADGTPRVAEFRLEKSGEWDRQIDEGNDQKNEIDEYEYNEYERRAKPEEGRKIPVEGGDVGQAVYEPEPESETESGSAPEENQEPDANPSQLAPEKIEENKIEGSAALTNAWAGIKERYKAEPLESLVESPPIWAGAPKPPDLVDTPLPEPPELQVSEPRPEVAYVEMPQRFFHDGVQASFKYDANGLIAGIDWAGKVEGAEPYADEIVIKRVLNENALQKYYPTKPDGETYVFGGGEKERPKLTDEIRREAAELVRLQALYKAENMTLEGKEFIRARVGDILFHTNNKNVFGNLKDLLGEVTESERQAANFPVETSIPELIKQHGINLDRDAISGETTLREVLAPDFIAKQANPNIVAERYQLQQLIWKLINDKKDMPGPESAEERQRFLERFLWETKAKEFLVENLRNNPDEPVAMPAAEEVSGQVGETQAPAPQKIEGSGAATSAWADIKEKYEIDALPEETAAAEEPSEPVVETAVTDPQEALRLGEEQIVKSEWFAKQGENLDVGMENKVDDIKKVVIHLGLKYDDTKSPGANLAYAILRDTEARVKNGKVDGISPVFLETYQDFGRAAGRWAEWAQSENMITPEAAAEILAYRDKVLELKPLEEPPSPVVVDAIVPERVEIAGPVGAQAVFTEKVEGSTRITEVRITNGFEPAVGEMMLKDIDAEWRNNVLNYLRKTSKNESIALNKFTSARDHIPLRIAKIMTYKDLLKDPDLTGPQKNLLEERIASEEKALVQFYGKQFEGISHKISGPAPAETPPAADKPNPVVEETSVPEEVSAEELPAETAPLAPEERQTLGAFMENLNERIQKLERQKEFLSPAMAEEFRRWSGRGKDWNFGEKEAGKFVLEFTEGPMKGRWKVVEAPWYGDQFDRPDYFTHERVQELTNVDFVKEGAENGIFFSIPHQDFERLIEENGGNWGSGPVRERLEHWIGVAEENFRNQEASAEKLEQFDLPKDRQVGFLSFIPPEKELQEDPIVAGVVDQAKHMPLLLKQHGYDLVLPETGSVAHMDSQNAAEAIEEYVKAMRGKNVRDIYLDLNGHGSAEGIFFGATADAPRLSGEELADIIQKYPDTKFYISTVACEGGGLRDLMMDLAKRPGVKDRLDVFLQAKPYEINQEGRLREKEGGLPGIYSTYYNMLFMKFLNEPKPDGGKRTFGEALRATDLEVQKYINVNPENIIDGELIAALPGDRASGVAQA